MSVLITGGCGFLGSNLAAAGLHRGEHVTVFDNLSRTGASENLAWLRSLGNVHFIHGDVRNVADVDLAIAAVVPHAVFHAAGQVAMTTSLERPRHDFEVNALGTFNVIDSVRRHAPDAVLVYSSTNKVYGDLLQYRYEETATRWACIDRPEGFDEATPLSFHSPYGCSKGAADQYVLDAHRMWGLRSVVFRHSSMYGGRQFATFDQGWVGWFCTKAVEQQAAASAGREPAPFTINGDGKQVRDVLHADDTVEVYFRAVERADEVAGDVFNIGGGWRNSLSLLELFGHLEAIIGVELRYHHLPARHSDQLVFIADNRNVERSLGWQASVGIEAGLKDMVRWVRSVPQ